MFYLFSWGPLCLVSVSDWSLMPVFFFFFFGHFCTFVSWVLMSEFSLVRVRVKG
jgi:hypothetical protein